MTQTNTLTVEERAAIEDGVASYDRLNGWLTFLHLVLNETANLRRTIIGHKTKSLMTELRLTRHEFAAALKRGLGRALLYVQQFGISEVKDIVLDACLKNPAYDPQCESSRAAWLLMMIKGSEEYCQFSSAILNALEHETELYDLEHLCELSAQMAIAGDQNAGSALRSKVLGQKITEPWDRIGDHAFVALYGVQAIVELARLYGRALITHPEDTAPSLSYLTDHGNILSEAENILQNLAKTDSEVSAYWSYEQAHISKIESKTQEERQREIRERARSELSLGKILEDASAASGSYPSKYTRFGKHSTLEERGIVLQRLLSETDENACLRLLWVFRRIPLPELHPRLWEFATSCNKDIRCAAIEALAQLHDIRVWEFGRSKLNSPAPSDLDPEVLDIFIRNYKPQDEELIMSQLKQLSPADDNAHGLGSSLLDICDENISSDLLGLLVWVYEKTPCSICRHHAVKRMAELNRMPDKILAECFYDADDDIRKIAYQIKNAALPNVENIPLIKSPAIQEVNNSLGNSTNHCFLR